MKASGPLPVQPLGKEAGAPHAVFASAPPPATAWLRTRLPQKHCEPASMTKNFCPSALQIPRQYSFVISVFLQGSLKMDGQAIPESFFPTASGHGVSAEAVQTPHPQATPGSLQSSDQPPHGPDGKMSMMRACTRGALPQSSSQWSAKHPRRVVVHPKRAGRGRVSSSGIRWNQWNRGIGRGAA